MDAPSLNVDAVEGSVFDDDSCSPQPASASTVFASGSEEPSEGRFDVGVGQLAPDSSLIASSASLTQSLLSTSSSSSTSSATTVFDTSKANPTDVAASGSRPRAAGRSSCSAPSLTVVFSAGVTGTSSGHGGRYEVNGRVPDTLMKMRFKAKKVFNDSRDILCQSLNGLLSFGLM